MSNKISAHDYGKPPTFFPIDDMDLKKVKSLLDNGAVAKDFIRLLHSAVSKKSTEIVEALLLYGVDANVRDGNGFTALHFAVYSCCEEINERARETDAENTSHSDAIFNEFLKMADLLLKFNANVDLANEAGLTPLHTSARCGNVEVTTFLLNKGAEVNVKIRGENPFGTQLYVQSWQLAGNTPLHFAVANDHKEVVNLLLERGADADCVGLHGRTPLHLASEKGNVEMIKILLKFNECVYYGAWDKDDQYHPLHLAIMNGHAEVVKFLLENNAEVKRQTNSCMSPLYLAAKYGDSAIIDIILSFNPDVNVVDREGNTALHIASQRGDATIVGKLLEHGADINEKNHYSSTPFDCAWRSELESRMSHEQFTNMTPYHDTLDVLFRHREKLEADGVDCTGSVSSLDPFYTACHLEITRLKSEFLENTDVSCYDLLRKDDWCLAEYLRENENVRLAVNSKDFKSEFPNYADKIVKHFELGCRIWKFLRNQENALKVRTTTRVLSDNVLFLTPSKSN